MATEKTAPEERVEAKRTEARIALPGFMSFSAMWVQVLFKPVGYFYVALYEVISRRGGVVAWLVRDHFLFFALAIMGTDDIDHNYNGYYGISGNFFAREGGSNVANWSTWRSSYGQDANSSNGINPVYVNPSGNDFRLQSGSPARTWGRTMTRIHGNDGQTIPAGAYITGNEVIGPNLSTSNPPPAPPTGF